jgi:hypothetical protein
MGPIPLHLGVDQPKSIQLLYLDQACWEDFISNLTNDHSCSFRNGHKDLLDVRMNRGWKYWDLDKETIPALQTFYRLPLSLMNSWVRFMIMLIGGWAALHHVEELSYTYVQKSLKIKSKSK